MAHRTEPIGVELLLSKLDKVSKVNGPKWTARCPLHNDPSPSLVIEVKPHKVDGRPTVLVTCSACNDVWRKVLRATGVPGWKVNSPSANAQWLEPRPKFVEKLSKSKVMGYVAQLSRLPERLAYLTDVRGLTPDTIATYRIGWDESRERYTLPVHDESGALVNVRRYKPGATDKKMVNSSGNGEPARLYPWPPKAGDRPVIICEGEWDALLLRQHGWSAVTGTHGAKKFLPEWGPLFAGRHVAFLFDCDEAGRTNPPKHAEVVRRHTRNVRIVDLAPERSDSFDVSDWFAEGRSAEELRTLINGAQPLGRGEGRHADR